MPCFSVGTGIAKVIAKTHGIPLYSFSHQGEGILGRHYMAQAVWIRVSTFSIAFHVSGV